MKRSCRDGISTSEAAVVVSALAPTCRPEECMQLLEQVMPWEDEEDLLGGIEHLLLEEDNQPVR